MIRDEAIRLLIEIQNRSEEEFWGGIKGINYAQNHKDADAILCDLLAALGYQDVVDEYKKIEKFYN